MSEYLVQKYLDATRRRYPGKIAIFDSGNRETFESLYTMSNKLANCLKSHGVCRRDRVVILLKRSCFPIIAMMGVLKADAVYVPVDPRSPFFRVRKIIEDCLPTALICNSEFINDVNQISKSISTLKSIIICGDKKTNGDYTNIYQDGPFQYIRWDEVDGESTEEPEYGNIDADLAYILYTSGSTGNPKGVMVTHLNIRNYIEWAVECFNIREDDTILNTAQFHFDMSTFDIYCALKTGASLCIALDSHLLFPNKLLELMENGRVTVWKSVSSLLVYLAKTGVLKKERIPLLRTIMFAGEVLPTKYLMQWMNIYTEKKFFNVYGPTEATGISMYYPVEQIPKDIAETVPIGKPCSNTEVFLMKEDHTVAGVGEVGELCIRGSGVSIGYWNDVTKSERAFVANPATNHIHDRIYRSGDFARVRADGNYEFVGRMDFQVKYMGYRIELYEIEKALLSFPAVNSAAVMLCDSGISDLQELVAFLELENGCNLKEVISHASKILPHYMVPKRIMKIDNIPLTSRGKTDREVMKNLYRLNLQSMSSDGSKS